VLGRERHAITRVGSPPYMAPEQFQGRTVLQSDIYALGVIMYEMLTATLPVAEVQAERVQRVQLEGKVIPPRRRNPSVPDQVNDVVMKALALRVEDRYRRPAEVAAALASRPVTPGAEGLREIRARLSPRAESTPRFCWNCARVLARRSLSCAHCGERAK
jgi:serine/threonine protein kinase